MRSVEDDEEAQKRGVVNCVYCVGGGFNVDLQLVRKAGSLLNALPIRFDSVHVCHNNPRIVPFICFCMVIMMTHTRVRSRTHYGSDEECQSILSSFGIPISAFPVSPRGEFNLENHRSFVAMQRTIEATKSKGKEPLLCVAQKAKKNPKEKAHPRQSIVKEDVFVAAPQPDLNEPTGYGGVMGFSNFGFLPRPSFASPLWSVIGAPNLPSVVPLQRRLPVVSQPHITGPTSASREPPAKLWESPAKPYVIHDPLQNDILLGRGKPIQQRAGNVRFREMLDKHMDKYDRDKHMDKYDRGEKSAKFTAYILHLVKEGGGRFLMELEDGGWVEVNEATAREKVSRAFSTRRKVLQAALKKDRSTA
jgi:hypothetical protein